MGGENRTGINQAGLGGIPDLRRQNTNAIGINLYKRQKQVGNPSCVTL
jgi:hypothetical protein